MLHVVLKEMDRWHMVSSSISNASSQFHKTLFFSPLKHSNIRLSTCKSIDIIFYFQRRFVNIKIWYSMDFSHVLLLKNIYIIEVRYYNTSCIHLGTIFKMKRKKIAMLQRPKNICPFEKSAYHDVIRRREPNCLYKLLFKASSLFHCRLISYL